MTETSFPLHTEENGIPYTLHGGVYLPDLKLSSDSRPIGRYGRLHRDFLKEHHTVRYNSLVLSGELPRLLSDLNELDHHLPDGSLLPEPLRYKKRAKLLTQFRSAKTQGFFFVCMLYRCLIKMSIPP